MLKMDLNELQRCVSSYSSEISGSEEGAQLHPLVYQDPLLEGYKHRTYKSIVNNQTTISGTGVSNSKTSQ